MPSTLRLAAGEVKAVENQREIYADHVSIPLCPLGRVRKLQLIALWTTVSLTLSCMTKGGTACEGRHALLHDNTALDVAASNADEGQKFLTPQLWQQLYQSAIKESPALIMANMVELANKEYPDMTKRSMPLTAYMSNYLLDAGLEQLTMHSSKQVTMTGDADDGTSCMGSFVLGLSQRMSSLCLRLPTL